MQWCFIDKFSSHSFCTPFILLPSSLLAVAVPKHHFGRKGFFLSLARHHAFPSKKTAPLLSQFHLHGRCHSGWEGHSVLSQKTMSGHSPYRGCPALANSSAHLQKHWYPGNHFSFLTAKHIFIRHSWRYTSTNSSLNTSYQKSFRSCLVQSKWSNYINTNLTHKLPDGVRESRFEKHCAKWG